MKILDQKIVPCASCNPDGETEFDVSKWVWCDDCRGHGFMWLRTVQLDHPLEKTEIKLDFSFYFGDES